MTSVYITLSVDQTKFGTCSAHRKPIFSCAAPRTHVTAPRIHLTAPRIHLTAPRIYSAAPILDQMILLQMILRQMILRQMILDQIGPPVERNEFGMARTVGEFRIVQPGSKRIVSPGAYRSPLWDCTLRTG